MKRKKRYKDQEIDEDDWAFKFTKKKSPIKKPKRKDYHPRVYKKGGQKVYCCKTLNENQTEDELLSLMKQNKWTLQDEILGENDEHVYVFTQWQ
jgi:hypothetical protein